MRRLSDKRLQLIVALIFRDSCRADDPFAPKLPLPDADDLPRVVQFVPKSVNRLPVDLIPRMRGIDTVEEKPVRKRADMALQLDVADWELIDVILYSILNHFYNSRN